MLFKLSLFLALATMVTSTASSAISQNANFDDLTGNLVAPPPVGTYRNLNFSGFGIGVASPVAVALQPASMPNFAVGPSLTNPLASLIINTVGTKTKSFDLNAIKTGCYAATRNAVAAPPIDCTITFTGTKFRTGKTVQASFDFKTGNALGVSIKSLAVKPFDLPNTFKQLSSVRLAITKSTLPNIAGATANLGIDDVEVVTYTLK